MDLCQILLGKKPSTFQKYCRRKKIGFLTFEYSGHGKSSGKFIEGNISRWTNDAKQLIKAKIKSKKKINIYWIKYGKLGSPQFV